MTSYILPIAAGVMLCYGYKQGYYDKKVKYRKIIVLPDSVMLYIFEFLDLLTVYNVRLLNKKYSLERLVYHGHWYNKKKNIDYTNIDYEFTPNMYYHSNDKINKAKFEIVKQINLDHILWYNGEYDVDNIVCRLKKANELRKIHVGLQKINIYYGWFDLNTKYFKLLNEICTIPSVDSLIFSINQGYLTDNIRELIRNVFPKLKYIKLLYPTKYLIQYCMPYLKNCKTLKIIDGWSHFSETDVIMNIPPNVTTLCGMCYYVKISDPLQLTSMCYFRDYEIKLHEFTNLTYLNVNIWNQETIDSISTLLKLENLRLVIDNQYLRFHQLGKLHKLKYISFERNVPTSIIFLLEMTNLISIELTINNKGGNTRELVKVLTTLKNIKYLYVKSYYDAWNIYFCIRLCHKHKIKYLGYKQYYNDSEINYASKRNVKLLSYI